MRNPVGEKIIIKKSTVSSKKWGSADAEKMLAFKEGTNFRHWGELNYHNCANSLPEKECRRTWLGEDYESKLAEIKDLKEFIARDLEINYLEFTPIFVDLNNQKTPLEKVSYACPTGQEKGSNRDLIRRATQLANFTVGLRNPGFDLRPMEEKLCTMTP